MKLSETEKMLAEWLEFLDDEDGKLPFPEWAGETGWVKHDDGSLEDWGIYLLRLAHDEIAALKQVMTGIVCGECAKNLMECVCPGGFIALLQEPFTGGTVSAYFDTSRESE